MCSNIRTVLILALWIRFLSEFQYASSDTGKVIVTTFICLGSRVMRLKPFNSLIGLSTEEFPETHGGAIAGHQQQLGQAEPAGHHRADRSRLAEAASAWTRGCGVSVEYAR